MLTIIEYLTINKLAANKSDAKQKVLAGKVYIDEDKTPCLNHMCNLGSLWSWSHRQIGDYILLKKNVVEPTSSIYQYIKDNLKVSIDMESQSDYYNTWEVTATVIVRLDERIVGEFEESCLTPSC